MRIVQFIDSMTSAGAETLVKDYAVEMRKTQNVSVLCYSISRNTNNERELKENQVNCVYIADEIFENARIQKYKGTKQRYLFQLMFTVKKVGKIMLELRPDVLHMHLNTIFFYPFISKTQRKHMKVFYTIHSNEPDGYKEKFIYRLKLRIIKLYKEIKIIVLQEDMRKNIENYIDCDRIYVVNNGIKIDRYRNVKISKKEIRKKMDIPENAFVVGNVGRYIPVKNHVFLLKVFKEIYKENKNTFLVLVGHGEEEGNIRRTIEELEIDNNVKLITDSNNIPEILRAMDVFVFPSKNEGFGIALLEAEAANLPCVVSQAINSEVILSPNVKQLDICAGEKVWKETILGIQFSEIDVNIFIDFDIQVIVNKVLSLYEA